ncbi:MAG: aminoacyl-tRNA hydrolase [Sphingobium sp.]|nr:aminoacyl-tRNA hydrolase [Sphingobium sp.]
MPQIQVTRSISIDESELAESATRASGAGGQHVNTTDSAVVLRFDVAASPSLPEAVKRRLAQLAGSRLTQDGVLILRSEGSRSQFENRREVRERLIALIAEATIVPRKRRPTKPSKAAKAKRVDTKKARSGIKAGRGKVRLD